MAHVRILSLLATAAWALMGLPAVDALASATAASAPALLECRHSNYVSRNGKILALDPEDPSVSSEITIKGVTWGGMEKDSLIPDGLWGTEAKRDDGIQATTVSTLMEFLTNNSFNSVRLPLNAAALNADPYPQLGFIHSYENRELTTWADANSVKYFDLLARVVQTLGVHRITVLLDVHLLGAYPEDALWYTAPYVNVTQSATYNAVSYLASTLCNATQWNILGVDLKDEPADARWVGNPEDVNIKNDWRGAANVLANRVLELCPQWLVFVGGASSPTDAERFQVADGYAPSNHWAGGNLKNATAMPLDVDVADKIVLAPHAHAHGRMPQNYMFTADSNCSLTAVDSLQLEGDAAAEPECVDFVDGKKVASKIPCYGAGFGCSAYAHLAKEELVTQYEAVLAEAMGDVVTRATEGANGAPAVVLGAVSGVYGATTQPHQTVVLDRLIEYAAKTLRGGYFYALNPDTELYVEDVKDKDTGAGVFGRTHYGIFQATSWQKPNEDLLKALAKLPASDIPCYGGAPPGENAASWSGLSVTAAAVVTVLAVWLV